MAVTGLLNIVVLSLTAKYAWLLVVIFSVVFYHCKMIYLPYSQQLRLLERQSVAAAAAIAAETVDGIQYIRANRETDCLASIYFTLKDIEKTFYHSCRARDWLVLILDLFASLSGTVLVILAHTFAQSSSAVALGLASVILVRFSNETVFLINLLGRLDDFLGAVSRVRSFCDDTPVEDSSTSDAPVHSSWPAFGRIDLENVTTERRYVYYFK